MKPTTVIYHSADFDGIFCREIAKKRFGNDADYIGWDYGQPIPAIPEGVDLYILDLAIEPLMSYPGLVWIDHHKSSIEKYSPDIFGLRIDGVAACRLAYQYWFGSGEELTGYLGTFPFHEDNLTALKLLFIRRYLTEPLAVQLAGEYDVWDKRNPDAELFQYGLKSRHPDLFHWYDLLNPIYSSREVTEILKSAEAVKSFKEQEDAIIIQTNGFDLKFEGLMFLAVNSTRYNSQLFTAGIKPHHEALLGFNWNGKIWKVSMYHAPGHEHHDLSEIAKMYGGGGHRGACGFEIKNITVLKSDFHLLRDSK